MMQMQFPVQEMMIGVGVAMVARLMAKCMKPKVSVWDDAAGDWAKKDADWPTFVEYVMCELKYPVAVVDGVCMVWTTSDVVGSPGGMCLEEVDKAASGDHGAVWRHDCAGNDDEVWSWLLAVAAEVAEAVQKHADMCREVLLYGEKDDAYADANMGK